MDARIEELERISQDVAAKLADVAELTAELARRRFESVVGNVRAVVDGQGGLVDLWIDEPAVGPRVAHPGQVGGEIVAAVAGARQAAADENTRRFRPLLPDMYPAPAPEPVADEDDWDPFYQGED